MTADIDVKPAVMRGWIARVRNADGDVLVTAVRDAEADARAAALDWCRSNGCAEAGTDG